MVELERVPDIKQRQRVFPDSKQWHRRRFQGINMGSCTMKEFDIYQDEDVLVMEENEEIDPIDAAFMKGYLQEAIA